MTEARLIVENFVDSMTHLMELLIEETSILNNKAVSYTHLTLPTIYSV